MHLCLVLLRAVDVDLGFDDGHEAAGEDLTADLELLCDHCFDGGLDWPV